MVQCKSILKDTNNTYEVATGGSFNAVCWGDMTIYEFPNILGDNPAVQEGAPLTIAWKHDDINVITVDHHEFMRQSQPCRKRKDLILSGGARDTFLLGEGYRLEELLKVAEELKKIRDSRRSNIKGKWEKFKSVIENPFRVKDSKKKILKPRIVVSKAG